MAEKTIIYPRLEILTNGELYCGFDEKTKKWCVYQRSTYNEHVMCILFDSKLEEVKSDTDYKVERCLRCVTSDKQIIQKTQK